VPGPPHASATPSTHLQVQLGSNAIVRNRSGHAGASTGHEGKSNRMHAKSPANSILTRHVVFTRSRGEGCRYQPVQHFHLGAERSPVSRPRLVSIVTKAVRLTARPFCLRVINRLALNRLACRSCLLLLRAATGLMGHRLRPRIQSILFDLGLRPGICSGLAARRPFGSHPWRQPACPNGR
jgi:hypothetical protein